MKNQKTFEAPDNTARILDTVCAAAKQFGVKVYAVGGYIRDSLLGKPFSGDIDFSVVGNAPKFAQFLIDQNHLKGKVQIYRRFGTARITLNKTYIEFASSRKESYKSSSRNPDVQPAPFVDDLARRDFTVNALAVDVENPSDIIDRFDGLSDLENGIIRTPLDPITTFSDDPLRILRAIRFAARLDFEIHGETWKALVSEKERLKIVARERINEEFFKILSDNPPSAGLLLLHESGVLDEIFPEIEKLGGVEQIGKHHHKDVFLHSLKVVDKVASLTDRVDLRFAALVHDIGKPKTKRFDDRVGWTFHGHEYVGYKMLKRFGKKYSLGEGLIENTSNLVRLHMRPMNLQDDGVSDSAIRRLVVQAGEQIDDLLLLCRADITSGNQQKVRRYLAEFDSMLERMNEIEKKDQLRSFHSPIDGTEIMKRTGLPQGPQIGLIKAYIEEAILDGEIENTPEGAESFYQKALAKVMEMDRESVLSTLREIMRARKEGVPPDQI